LEEVRLPRASPWITVPVTLAGYLAVGWLGWRLCHPAEDLGGPPPTVSLDLLAPADAAGGPPKPAPPAPKPAPAPPRPAAAPPAPPALTARASAVPASAPPPPPQPEASPDQAPTTLPTRDLSHTALPAGPGGGVAGGTGAGTGPGAPGGIGFGGGNGGGGAARVVEREASEMAVAFRPPLLAYPPLAKSRHVQGTVRVEILVGTDGLPATVHAVDGPPLLRPAAEAYAAKYRFRPEISNGVPVLQHFFLSVVFQLN
jgi:protein TonB